MVRLLEEGARDFIVKPFSERDLLVRVRNLTAAEHAREQAELQKRLLYSVFKQAPLLSSVLRGPDHLMELANPPTRGIFVVASDVTAQVHARQQMSSLRDAAESASRAKDEFLAMLGHELRNPLSPILTALQLMRLRGDAGSERGRTVIERQVSHLTRLVDDLLDVARGRGRVELQLELVELSEIVARALEMASPLIEERAQRVSVAVPSRGLRVEGTRRACARSSPTYSRRPPNIRRPAATSASPVKWLPRRSCSACATRHGHRCRRAAPRLRSLRPGTTDARSRRERRVAGC